MKNTAHTLTPDAQLTTRDDLLARLAIIRKTRDTVTDTEPKNNSIAAFRAKCAKAAKLTERESAICNRLAAMRREGK